MNKILYALLFIMLIPTVSAETYHVFVDKEFGFFGVRSNNTTELISYDNKTLFIDIGDKVVWENYVVSDERVTVVSSNKLWNETDVVLGWRSKTFGYTFNKSGTYKFHLKENQIFKEPENFTEPLNTSNWFKYQTIIVGKKTNEKTTITKKNKIIATTNINQNTEETEEYDEEIIPQITTEIEKSASPYEKYTILELLKSILKRT